MNYVELVVFIIYLAFMLGIGVVFFFKSKGGGEKDYFLGGRQMGPWVSALSAGASDMSAWVLMGLPASIYAYGMGQTWIAIGLAIGYALSWIFEAPRLRRFSIAANDSITIPQYLTNRFLSKSKALQILCALIFLVAYTVYAASSIKACGTLFNTVIGIDSTVAMYIAAIIIIAYTFLGGFSAVCWTDFFQGILMFFCVLAVPTIAIFSMGGPTEFFSQVEAFNPNFLNMLVDGATGVPYTAMGIISLLAWGLGYFGQPHILVRFMGISSPQAIKKSRRIATVWVLISLTAAIMIGVSGRMFLGDGLLLNDGNQETIYISMVAKIFPVFIAGIFLSAILAAIMSTADSQLLVTASAITEDFYHNKIRKNASEKELMWVSRGCVMAVAIIAVLIATNQNSTILGLVSYAWGGFGSAFGPLVLCSLFWRRTNKQGAYAGIIVGGVVDLVWAQLSGGIFDLYEIVPGFVFGLLAIVVVSLLTPAPTKAVTDEFDSYHHCVE